MTKETYKRLRDMPRDLSDVVRARIIELRTRDNPLAFADIAARIHVEYEQADLPVETVRSILRSANAKPPKVAVDRAEVPDERQQMLEDLQEHAKQFLTEYRSLPEVPDHIRATRVEDMGFDTPQVGVALFSDLHYYSKIIRAASNGMAEYNIDIARERLGRWRNGVLRFTQMNQVWVELEELFILALGDDLEGHGQMFEAQALQMSESIMFQMMGFAEDMTGIILSYLERYPHITIIKVPGNHGRTAARSRGAYTPDNFELMAWEVIAERVRHQTGGEWTTSDNGVRSLTGGQIDFHIHYGAIALFDILGWLCAARHGHGIRGLQATYTGAIDNKMRLNAVVGEIINYYFKAHLHEAQSSESEIQGEVLQNGSFVGPSLLSVEMSRAAASLPSQEFMLFHPKRGKTHHYRIHLAEVDEVRQVEVIGRTS
jgi:hypothetical protein